MAVEREGALNRDFLARYSQQGDTVFDKSVSGREGAIIPDPQVAKSELPPARLLRQELVLPEMSEPEVVRHFIGLGEQNFSIGKGPYPLGSCTMKYNPRRHEEIAGLQGFAEVHPEQPVETLQGSLAVLYGLQAYLAEITGMHATTLAPMGGAHGELTGVLMIKALHEKNGEGEKRRKMFIPDSAHGTNPASAAMAGFEVVTIKSGLDGNMDMKDFMEKLGEKDDVAGAMFTQPNTLGLFDVNLREIARVLHEHGALVYGDGANMNALLGKVKPGHLGIDVMHINTHKALTTPHGGGGPGAGPVMVSEELADFLPSPVVSKDEDSGKYFFAKPEYSIGRMSGWYGNVAVLLRAYSYIRTMGEDGLRAVSENAVLAANYVKAGLINTYPIQYGRDRHNMHEVVFQGRPYGNNLSGSHPTTDIAKRLIDYGFHPPTVYFPLIADQALMVEPTETEGIESLDRLIDAMKAIAQEAIDQPELLHNAPHFTPVGRLDEVTAARKPVLRWRPRA